jgi:4'-phosphopantetheinyl transferase
VFMPTFWPLPTNCFSAYERARLGALPEASRARAFYRCWTRHEAYLKATGSGPDSTLQEFDVLLAPEQLPALLRVKWSEPEPARWHMQDLDLPVGYIGTLVMERRLGLAAKPHTIVREV